ncbi:Do family serine endopeptidase [Acidocella aromatica]|uniref:Serine protease Do n=1 Tax=Acidocella aromatica TaxID=1303579 RepID=A0A840VIM2_9PROT|nr:Do family serine endopeptidase [Acidocella aromatica]MBB5372129.1 serine protease Do [Acidocella aromatica]
MRTTFIRGTALTLALFGATALAGLPASPAHAADASLDETSAVQQGFTPVPDFSGLVKHVAPAVVSVDVHLKLSQTSDDQADNGGGQGQPGLPPGFPQIPGFPGFPFAFGTPQQPQAVEAKGSGFLIDQNGTIVTNNHVVKDARTVTVTLSDGNTYPAKILGTDAKTDLAVLKINAGHPLPYVDLGPSSSVQPGEWVVAMGNPFGLDGTVTAGIVSALGRDIGDGPYDKFIQIDAPINEGNSGGPLFDQKGEVIGVNTAILSPSGGSVGIGFAIPSDMIKRVVTQLISNGKVVRGYLGVAAQQISPQMAQALGLPSDNPAKDGALVAAVSPGSPAEKAGLKPGDVITSVNGQAVTSPGDLASDIANVDPNHKADIVYLRNGKQNTVSISVTTMPANPDAGFQQNGSGNSGAAQQQGALGLTLAPLTPDARNQLNLPDSANGAVITAVKPNSLADQAGLQPGDLLVGVGATNVNTPDDAVAAIAAARKSGSGALALRIIRQGQALFVGIGLSNNGGNSGN